MKQKKQYPPSWLKYNLQNPVISVRLTRDLREMLDVLRDDKTYSVVLKEILEGKLDPVSEIARKLEGANQEIMRLRMAVASLKTQLSKQTGE